MFEELHKRMNRFWNDDRTLNETDPEYVALFSDFAYDEVVNEEAANHPDLTDADRCLAIVASIIGAQGMDAFEMMLPVAYQTGVTSVQLKELIYQSTAFVGFARVLPYLKKLNDFLNAENVRLPLAPQSTVDAATRASRGREVRDGIFGEGTPGDSSAGAADETHIDAWLTAACYGDYYTRTGLSVREREMIALCLLAALGGCDDRLRAHVLGNIRVGNDAGFLIAVISQCLPYIGFPQAMHAIDCIRGADEGKRA